MGDSMSWAADRDDEIEWSRLKALREKNAIPGDKRPTLKQYNDQEVELHQKMTKYPKLNGLLCDDCKSELYDTNGVVMRTRTEKGNWDSWNIVSMSPGRIAVHCKCCQFRGSRVE